MAKKEAPAKVAHSVHENELNTIELTPTAEERLGLQSAVVEMKSVRRRRSYGAEIALPTGASITVASPVTGTLQSPTPGGIPPVGTGVTRGQALFLLVPLLSPERSVLTPSERVSLAQAKMQLSQAQVDAAGLVKQAQVQVDAAKINLRRAERLLEDMVGTAKNVDDAKAQLELAQKTLDAALERQSLLDEIQLDPDAGEVQPLPIESPRDGIIRAEFAAARTPADTPATARSTPPSG